MPSPFKVAGFLLVVLLAFSASSFALPVTAASHAVAVQQDEPPRLQLLAPSGVTEWPATDIFNAISPAVAFISTPTATGSGVLIDYGYLLTNAHVVWPHDAVRVVFPNGSEHLDVPVIGWDLTADLAILGPLETDIPPVGLVDNVDLAVGSDVYLIGYPAEVDAFPQPTITNGILSRIRTWDALDYTFFQVDATIAGGQSGGVLVTHSGDVVGISTFYYSGFGLAGAVADALPRLNALLGHGSAPARSQRSFTTGTPAVLHEDTLRDDLDHRRYLILAEPGEEVELTVEGVGRPQLDVLELFSDYIAYTEPLDFERKDVSLSVAVQSPAPHIVEVYQLSPNSHEYTLTSSHPLLVMPDLDDRRELQFGSRWIGTIETPFDIDTFSIFLFAGERIEIETDALTLDTGLALFYQSDTLYEEVEDDDSGGGIFGHNARIVYDAPETGFYQLLLFSQTSGIEVGNYILSVKNLLTDAEPASLTVSQALLPTVYGAMAQYEDDPFSVMIPFDWQEIPAEECMPDASLCLVYGDAVMMLVEEPLAFLPKRERNGAGYLAVIRDMLDTAGAQVVNVDERATYQDRAVFHLAFDVQSERMLGERFIYVDDEQQRAFNVTFIVPRDAMDAFRPMIDFVFDSFRVWGDEAEQANSAVHHFDEGMRFAAVEDLEGALAAYTDSIRLDPTFAQAYGQRAYVHYGLGDVDAALADMAEAVALAPEEAELFFDQAYLMWVEGEADAALTTVDRALEIGPVLGLYHNLRALILADLGEFDAAMADVDAVAELYGGELIAAYRDTLAYIYLLMDDPVRALAEYTTIMDQDVSNEYTLLGAGVAHQRLGEQEQAEAYFSEGRGLLADSMFDKPDPQLQRLLEMATERNSRR